MRVFTSSFHNFEIYRTIFYILQDYIYINDRAFLRFTVCLKYNSSYNNLPKFCTPFSGNKLGNSLRNSAVVYYRCLRTTGKAEKRIPGASVSNKREKIREGTSGNTDCLHDRVGRVPVFGYITCRVRDDGDVSLDDWRTTVHHVASQCRTSPGFPVAAWRESASPRCASVRAQNGRKMGRGCVCGGAQVWDERGEEREKWREGKKGEEEKGRRDSSRTIANAWTRCAEARTIPYLLAGSSLPRNRRLRAKLL